MFGVVIPVGPGNRELDRVDSLVDELTNHERVQDFQLWIVDDSPTPRDLGSLRAHATVIRTALRESSRTPDTFSAHVAGTLAGLRAMRDAGVDFGLKLDTDAAIMGPFSAVIRTIFANNPQLGVVGSYDIDSNGDVRDWSMWSDPLRRAHRALSVRRTESGVRIFWKSREDRNFVRAQHAAARDYAPVGAHCIGGAYAISSRFLETVPLQSEPWLGSGLGEDVVVGTLCSGAGLGMRSLTSPGDPFALSWKGLPAPPERIASAGHAIVHSVKASTAEEERLLRAQLQGAPRPATD